ncbi:MAG: DNRLRE domain-containing protein [Nitrospirota bacterium]
MKTILSSLLAISALLATSIASAATFTLSPTDDAYTSVFDPDTNFGNSSRLATNLNNLGQKQFSYLMFDLSGIPATQAIVSATLNLYQVTGAGAGESGVTLRRIADDSWDEMAVTWNSPPDTTGATVLEVNPNAYTYVGWSQWDLLASGLWDPSVDRTDGLLSLWLAEASSNDQAHQWCSDESASDPLCGEGREPYLDITTVAVPVPGSLWLVGSGLLGLLGRGRKKVV